MVKFSLLAQIQQHQWRIYLSTWILKQNNLEWEFLFWFWSQDLPPPAEVQEVIYNRKHIISNFSTIEREAAWIGVRKLGIPIVQPKYIHKVSNNKTILLQPGYEAVRTVRSGNNMFELTCKIEEGPKFCCSVPELEIYNESLVATTVVKNTHTNQKKIVPARSYINNAREARTWNF